MPHLLSITLQRALDMFSKDQLAQNVIKNTSKIIIYYIYLNPSNHHMHFIWFQFSKLRNYEYLFGIVCLSCKFTHITKNTLKSHMYILEPLYKICAQLILLYGCFKVLYRTWLFKLKLGNVAYCDLYRKTNFQGNCKNQMQY